MIATIEITPPGVDFGVIKLTDNTRIIICAVGRGLVEFVWIILLLVFEIFDVPVFLSLDENTAKSTKNAIASFENTNIKIMIWLVQIVVLAFFKTIKLRHFHSIEV